MVVDHLQRARLQRYNSDACFVCSDGPAGCCWKGSWRTQRCAAGVRFGRLSFLILIVDDAWRQDSRLVFVEPECRAYRYQSILF